MLFFFFFSLDSFFATSQYCSRYIRLPFLYSGFYIHEHYLALPVAMGLELDDVCGPFQRRPFYDSILWNCAPLQPEWRCEAGRAAKKLTVYLWKTAGSPDSSLIWVQSPSWKRAPTSPLSPAAASPALSTTVLFLLSPEHVFFPLLLVEDFFFACISPRYKKKRGNPTSRVVLLPTHPNHPPAPSSCQAKLHVSEMNSEGKDHTWETERFQSKHCVHICQEQKVWSVDVCSWI